MKDGKRKPKDKDPFGIIASGNMWDKKHKNEEVEKETDYSLGERSPYGEWVSENGGYDPIDPDNFTDDSQPWAVYPMSETQEEQFCSLVKLQRTLTGRQKEIVDLLFEGELNQSEIARKLGMNQSDVAKALKKISEKISQKIP